ncbi:sexual stage-specific protein kinase [Cryptosporidium ryanae]|uniref:sexual stage-specific protein kinase n=1 Tax=Cryptosporidium ryanae TaxID=515981 RepID=UPI00351A742B|nr:sexual stage-specific protein kinase [Cryptosporidium ryanae]
MNVRDKAYEQNNVTPRSLIVFNDGGLDLNVFEMDSVGVEGRSGGCCSCNYVCRNQVHHRNYLCHINNRLFKDDFTEHDRRNNCKREKAMNGVNIGIDGFINNRNRNRNHFCFRDNNLNDRLHFNDEDRGNRRNDMNGKKKLLFGVRNVVISKKNVVSISKLKNYKVYYYYGETFDNKRHGWGFLADENQILYEGMWYLDKAVGWYFLYRNSRVYFGYLDYSNKKENHSSYIFWDKEGELILCNNNFDNKEHLYFEFLELRENILNKPLNRFEAEGNMFCDKNCDLGSELNSSYRADFNLDFPSTFKCNTKDSKTTVRDEDNNSNDGCGVYEKENVSFSVKFSGSSQTKSTSFLDSRSLHSTKNNTSVCDVKGNADNICKSHSLDTLLFPPLTSASECLYWSKETVSRILASVGLANEAFILRKRGISGADTQTLSEKDLESFGILNTYNRRFLLRLFRLFWSFVDHTDPSLDENKKLLSSKVPYIPLSRIKFGNYIGVGAYSYIRKGILGGNEIICKIYFFGTENYNAITLDDKKLLNNKFYKAVFESHYPDYSENENNEYFDFNSSPKICYLYKFRRGFTLKANVYKYLPTLIKMRNWESRVLQYLSPHPNIVKCLGITHVGHGCEVLLLENCEGGSMDKYVFKSSGFKLVLLSKFSASRFELLSWMRDIATGMQHAHELGILHRDLKLSNFFVAKTKEGNYIGKVGDFGISISTDVNSDYSTSSEFGNVYYAAPEVLRGEGFYKQSDVWSFGISMYEILTNTLAFEGFLPGLTTVMNAASVPVLEDISNTAVNLMKLLKAILDPDWRRRPSFKYISQEISNIIEDSERSILRRLGDFHYYENYCF